MGMASLSRRFALVLRKHREGARLTQEQLADKAGLHRTYVSLIERGQRSPTLETLQSLSDALGLSVGGVPVLVEKSKGAFFRLVKSTTSRPPWQAATGGTRHGEEYQQVGRSA